MDGSFTSAQDCSATLGGSGVKYGDIVFTSWQDAEEAEAEEYIKWLEFRLHEALDLLEPAVERLPDMGGEWYEAVRQLFKDCEEESDE